MANKVPHMAHRDAVTLFEFLFTSPYLGLLSYTGVSKNQGALIQTLIYYDLDYRDTQKRAWCLNTPTCGVLVYFVGFWTPIYD